MPFLRRLEQSAADASGQVLSTVIHGVSAVRLTRKPLHPRGRVVRARLDRHGANPTTGVAWLDETGSDDVLVRVSQAVGLPAWLPDIQGLAVRFDPGGTTPGDLLFATTGRGRITRFVLTPSRGLRRPMTTLLPYRTPCGPLLLGARLRDQDTFELSYATVGGPWETFALLVLSTDDAGHDPEISFDPVLHQLSGLEPYDWVRRLREPGYARARRDRS
jgi:hypothetical protein